MTNAIQGLLQSRLSVGAGRVAGGQVPTTPSARPSARPGPKPFEQQDLFPVRRVTDVSDEAIDTYATSDDDEGGYSGTAYPVTGAKPMDLTVTPFVRGTDKPEDVPGGVEPGFNTAYAGQLLEKAMGVNQYKYNPLTGRVEPDNLSAISLALPSPISMAAGFGQTVSRKNLQRISRMADAQEEGYALGMLQGRVVGVSPSPFGGYTLSGVLPQGLNVDQRRTIAEQLLGISQRSRTEFAKQQEERQRRVEASQASQEETDAGAGLFQPGDTPAQPDPRYTPPPSVTYTTDPGDDSAPAGNQYSFPSTPVEAPSAPSYSYTAYEPFAKGGKADPVQGNGFVEGSPDNYTKAQTVADDENRQVREGSFVLNAPTTEKLQNAGLLPKGVDNSDKKTTIKANKGGLMDVALSKGEYVIEPEEAQRIGYSFLEQLNDQGKAEVDRRQGMKKGGPAGTDLSGMPPLAFGLRPPISTDTKPEGFIQTPPPMPDTGIPPMLINGIDIEQVGRALSLVETRGYEDRNDGYFYTRSDTKSNPSSAFGPLQITGDTLSAMLKESDLLRIQMNEDINPGFANYLEKYATDARNKTNFRAFGLIYEGEKGKKAKGRAPTAAEKEMYKGLGTGSISLEDHKKYYPLLANIYLRYKAEMSDSEEDMVRRHFGNDKSTQKYRDAKIELGID